MAHFTQSASFKKLQASINTNNALRAELRNQFEQGEAEIFRSLNEVKASLMNLVEGFGKVNRSTVISASDISTSI